MYCSHCGSQIEPGSKYCPGCGAPIKTDAAPSPERTGDYETGTPVRSAGTTPVRAAAKKKNGNWFVRILTMVLVVLLARGVGYLVGYVTARAGNTARPASSNSYQSASKADNNAISVPEDLITLHTTMVLQEKEGIKDYITFYYGGSTHVLTAMNVEYVIDKAFGYSMENVKAAGFESTFPAFAEISYYEETDSNSFCAKMTELRNTDRVQAMIDCGLIEPPKSGDEGKPLDADSLMESLKTAGWTVTYDILGLHND